MKKLSSFVSGFVALALMVGFVPSRARAELGPNLVQNGSLETASTASSSLPLGFAKGGSGANTRVFTYPTPGRTGNGVKVEITAYTSGDAKWYFPHVPALPNTVYTYSDRYSATAKSYLTVQFKMADGTYKYKDLEGVLSVTGTSAGSADTWQKTERVFTTPANVVSMTVFHLIKGVGKVTVDDFSLVRKTAPLRTVEPVLGMPKSL